MGEPQTVERYQPERDYPTLCAWMRFYDLEPIVPEFLPPTGFVVQGLAMGFLYKTDTRIALLETLVSNGYAPRAQRDAATDAVVAAILEAARAGGFHIIQGYTTVGAVVDRALRHGFTVDDGPYRIVTRVL